MFLTLLEASLMEYHDIILSQVGEMYLLLTILHCHMQLSCSFIKKKEN